MPIAPTTSCRQTPTANEVRETPTANEVSRDSLPHRIMQFHHAVWKFRRGDQFQRHRATPGRNQGNTFADKRRHHANHELVDLPRVEKRRNNPSPTHDPDVFSLFLPQTAGKRLNRLVHELYARRRRGLRRIVREDKVLNSCIEARPGHAFLLKVERHVARLPAPQDRVNRSIERIHAVVVLRAWTVEPVERAVPASNKAVGTSGDGNNNFSLADHSARRSPTILGVPSLRGWF